MVENFTAHITPFGLDRNTFVYLPDDWQSSGRRYPVVYMFDGHNLFFDSTATYGTCWGLKEYMDAHPQAIIVAPECNHEGNARLEEYSPYDFVWQEYDIKGGLMSLYGVTAHNETFSRAACLSPSVRFSFTEVKAGIKKAELAPGTRVYISWGEREGKGRHALAQYTGKALEVTNLLTAGGATVYPYCQLDGRHCEADWRRQLGRCFTFLFGWR